MLQDDAAYLQVPDGFELAMSTDSLYQDVHFFSDTPPNIIAQKALRSNISDLYACGAVPYCYQMSLGFEQAPDQGWLSAFCSALAEDQKRYNIFCSGGDTSSLKAGGLAITISVMGLVPAGQGWKRSNARAGDVIISTGIIGKGYEAFIGGRTVTPDYPSIDADVLKVLRGCVHAGIDVSDGVLADAQHIAEASHLDLHLCIDKARCVSSLSWQEAMTGGDDYILLLCTMAENADKALHILRGNGFSDAHILGQVHHAHDIKNPQVRLLDAAGQFIDLPARGGWQHF